MAATFHDGCWGFKVLLILSGYVASFWIDSSFFTSFYMPVSMWLSAIFLFYQALLMMTVAYKIN